MGRTNCQFDGTNLRVRQSDPGVGMPLYSGSLSGGLYNSGMNSTYPTTSALFPPSFLSPGICRELVHCPAQPSAVSAVEWSQIVRHWTTSPIRITLMIRHLIDVSSRVFLPNTHSDSKSDDMSWLFVHYHTDLQ